MWKTLQFVENVLDSVDQTAASTLNKNQKTTLSDYKKEKKIELEKKIEDYKKSNEKSTQSDEIEL
jgi:tellurite resistance protein